MKQKTKATRHFTLGHFHNMAGHDSSIPQHLIIVNELLDIMIDNTGTATHRSYTFTIACTFSVHTCACIQSMFSLHAGCYHASNRAHTYHHVYRIL